MSNFIYRVTDPVSGEHWSWDRDSDEGYLYHRLAFTHGISFRGILRMQRLIALNDIRALDDEWKPPTRRELDWDARELNRGDLSLYELLDIRDRAVTWIRTQLARETDPVRRMKLEAMLEPSEEWLELEERVEAELDRRGFRRKANGNGR